MKSIIALIYLGSSLTLFAWEPPLTATSAEQIIAAISNDLPNVSAVIPINPNAIAGHYSDPGGFEGDELHLFSDGSYIFIHWSDISPDTIYEKGKWEVNTGAVHNTPDGSLPKATFPKDHIFFPLSVRGQTNIFLMGANWDYSYLMKREKPWDNILFKRCAYEQVEHYDGTKGESIKADLMARAWKPEFFRDE